MMYTATAFFIAFALFGGIILFLEIGRKLGRQQLQKDAEGARAGFGAMEGAIFALLGLLLAFSFSGAAGRFDWRRQLIVEETNAIGTAYLRLELLPPEDRAAMQEQFRQYVDARLETYKLLPDVQAARASLARTNVLQGEIWSRAVAACQKTKSQPVYMLLLPR